MVNSPAKLDKSLYAGIICAKSVDNSATVTNRTFRPILLVLIFFTFFLPQTAPCQNTSEAIRLKFSIVNYENGEYQKTADTLEKLAPTLSNAEDQIEAYKYLAYSYGMLNRIEKSKAVFKLALKKYPTMAIDTLEAPPNIAIIFKQVKLENKIDTMNSIPPKPIVIIQKKSATVPVLVVSCSIVCAGAGAGLLYYGNQQLKNYHSVTSATQSVLDHYWNRYLEATIGGGVCAAVAVLLPASYYLFSKKGNNGIQVSLSLESGLPCCVVSF